MKKVILAFAVCMAFAANAQANVSVDEFT